MQFNGAFTGVTWNSQALFTSKKSRQQGKQRHASRLARTYDFVGLQETHGTWGAAEAVRMPDGIHPFWSHGLARKAGIGLWVKETFLAKFNPVTEDSWEEIEYGRAGVLRLRGPNGALDIFVVYHHTGDSAEAKASRESTRTVLANSIKPQAEALTILMGDFNYVAHRRDRFSKMDADGSDTDSAE